MPSLYRMAVAEDKRVNNGMVNSEPQVIAEAIAMCQDNEAVIPHRKRDHSELSKRK